jgi:Zn-dependent protease
MIGSSYKIATVWGIPIKIHISLLILLVIVIMRTGGLNSGFVRYILLLEALIFTSIALHELGHSFVAIRKGCKVREITLMFMGGAAQMEQIPARPRDEVLMAVAGPAVSVMLGLLGWFGGSLLSGPLPALGSVLRLAGSVNLILAAFNMLPAFPMDGGRVLRAALTPRKGRLQATYIASRFGRIVAGIFILVGIFGVKGVAIFPPLNFVLVAVGFFIFAAAGREFRMVQIEETMRRQAYGAHATAWSAPPWPDVDDPDLENKVIIGPPPFANGPPSTTDIKPARKPSPFWR